MQVKAWKVSRCSLLYNMLCRNQAGALIIARQGSSVVPRHGLVFLFRMLPSKWHADNAFLGFKIYSTEAYGVLGCLQTT